MLFFKVPEKSYCLNDIFIFWINKTNFYKRRFIINF